MSELVYLRCPYCGQNIANPFVRGVGPVTNSHPPLQGKRRCRIIVTAAVTGHAHRIAPVRDGETFEQVLHREGDAAPDWRSYEVKQATDPREL